MCVICICKVKKLKTSNFVSLVSCLTLKLKKDISYAPLWGAESEIEVKQDTSETKFIFFFVDYG